MDKRMRGCRSPDELALLSQNELITQLLEAQSKIEELESIQMSSSSPSQIAREEKHVVDESADDSSNMELESSETSSSRPTFAYSSSTSSGIIANPSDGTHLIINKLKEMLDGFVIEGDFHKSGHNPPRISDGDEFIVAYEYKGNFPNCDEDLSLCDSCEDANEESEASRPSIVVKTIWEEGNDDEIDDDIDEFPLIPSPILNTPPYEYIFLTKENEAKCRIYLNPKLNQVFQDELKKLEKTEHEQLSGHQMQLLHHQKEGIALENHHMDINNQNHLANCSSTHGVDSVPSVSNVIHCFDPSDMDLELKKILMDKPPITHRIVRRKSRRERGSSVPAVDSYYGTKDLNKVGHASYFIPTLTSSEKQSIGWKPEYHYGHWKYSSINVPNSTTNQIPLHPHPHIEGETKSKQNHTNNNSGIHGNNPHHHQEIDVSGPFVIGADAQSLLESPASISRTGNVHTNDQEGGDTLSFITLSGGNDSGQSCHIIPNKSTLRKILRWIMPCIKTTKRSADNVSVDESASVTNSKPSKNSENNTSTPDSVKLYGTTGLDKVDSDETAIETLVEPPDRLNSPISHTHISFDVVGKTGRFHINPRQNISPDTQSHNSYPSRQDQSQHHGDSSRSHSHHHHSCHTHHHHHGIFHWKNILSHGTMVGNDSMTVVGGDVVESNPGSMTGPGTMEHDGILESSGALREVCLKREPNDSSDDDDLGVGLETNQDIERGGSVKKQNVRLRLKPCKAYSKLLTLKDLGYQSDTELEGHELEVSNAENEISLDESPGLDEKKHNKEQKCMLLGSTMRTGGTRKISSNDASGNDGDVESSGSGFAFSSLTVSNQNSFTTTHFCDEQEFCVNNIATSSRGEFIETRFLDPKDLMTVPRYEAKGGDYGSLPFVFAVDGDGIPTGTEEMDIMFDEDVIQWMDHDFVEDVEEELGLLNSRIDNMLWTGGENLLWSLRNMDNETAEKLDNNDGTPEKVGGKHRIITLNDSALQNETDAINDNYSHNNLN